LNGQTIFAVVLVDDGYVAASTAAAPGVNMSRAINLTLIVQPVNQRPVFFFDSNVSVSSLEDTAFDSGASEDPFADILGNISAGPGTEDDEQTLTFTVSCTGLAFNSGPTISPSGNLIFSPAAHQNGVATCLFRLQDSGGTDRGGSDTSIDKQFNINIKSVNDPPTFNLRSNHIYFPGYVPGFTSDVVTNDTVIYNFSAGPADEVSQKLSFTVEFSSHANQLFTQLPNITVQEINGNRFAQIGMVLAPYKCTTVPLVFRIRLLDDGSTDNGGQNTSEEHELQVWIHFCEFSSNV
jgi:hypothetical protein